MSTTTALSTDPSSELPPFPPGGVTAGVDWASTDHAIAIVDDTGAAIDRFTVTAKASGLRELDTHLSGAGVQEVAIERCDGQVVDALLAAGLTVVVISPNQLANLRSRRYRTSGNKDDRSDAYVLADTLRTDRARLRPLIPDTPATVALRSAVRAPQGPARPPDRTGQPTPRAPGVLLPGPVGLFTHLDGAASRLYSTTTAVRSRWLTRASRHRPCAKARTCSLLIDAELEPGRDRWALALNNRSGR